MTDTKAVTNHCNNASKKSEECGPNTPLNNIPTPQFKIQIKEEEKEMELYERTPVPIKEEGKESDDIPLTKNIDTFTEHEEERFEIVVQVEDDDHVPLYCSDCGKSFVNAFMLNNHRIIHTGERPHPCPKCDKVFGSLGNRNKHLVVHGNKERPFGCSDCGKTFSRLHNLTDHQRIHSGTKAQLCAVCGKSFTKPKMLRIHERMHELDTDYQPPKPGESGATPLDYRKALRFLASGELHHCSDCDKTFSSAAYLKLHKRMHTGEKPHSCSECKKTFISSSALKQHLQIHTGVKAFLCSGCGKGFSNMRGLKAHQTTHSGQSPFKCANCGKGFRWLGSLQRHQPVCCIEIVTASNSLSKV